MKVEWEKVTEETHRLKVPGGWLYRVFMSFSVEPGKHFGQRGMVMNTVFIAEQQNVVYIQQETK